ncbi:hypothetical protein K3U93_16500 [Mycobacterium malmoense]|uniref:hypothetical protein n=1 Tax=Mycobacterium malmoense TaxID=1780 RepID=UPI00111BE17C|nr:hypothetical protein [Mycobacterium malmoense]QZA16278.1 hypothetical protein K3U93_16500 [Mycobacterium malmoense]UNB93085.1 hypothetical protein H5T25_16485 [Mycobacterium malmoense]
MSALIGLGLVGDGTQSGLLFAPRTGLSEWSQAEDELAEAFALARATAIDGAPVVFLVQSTAILGRTSPLDAAVATGLLGGTRALAVELRKTCGYATVLAVGENVQSHTVAVAVELLLATRGANGQVYPLGTEHLGAALP